MRKNIRRIRGSGGDDPPPANVPVEASDNLQSRANLRLLDLLCEGEIVGLVDGLKSIYLNQTRLQNEDGSYNFTGITAEGKNGTQSQSYISGFSSVENEVSVDVELICPGGTPSPMVRQITNPNINKIRVRISIPQLSTTDITTGNINGATADVSVFLQPNGGSYSEVARRTVSGKSSSKYEFSLSFDLFGSPPWNLKVQRNTSDSTSQYIQNKTLFETYTEIVDAKLRYPNSAYVGLVLDAQQFSNIPSRYYDVKLLKIRVPSNYNPVTRVYTGSWDGTFQTAWSDNPAWCFYDLLTEKRYGLGNFIAESQIDKWSLYQIARYCDELVPDGFGDYEPRFTCNLLLADRTAAYTVLQNMASIFRGMIYWAGGALTAVQDSPLDAVMLYTPSNVIDGKFSYQGASAKSRHSVALVGWNDPEDFYKQKVEYVEDQDAILQFGVQQTDIIALGCTSRGQAHRLGKWLLYTEQNESEICLFKTGIDGLVARPGQIVKIADPVRAGIRLGGRISSATTSTVTVDADLTGALSGTLSVLLPDGTIEEKSIIGYSGRTISVQPHFSQAANPQSIWMVKSDVVEPKTFRIIGIKEEDGSYVVTSIKHDPAKFDQIEQNIILEPKSYSILSSAPSNPVNLSITEALYQSLADVKTKILFSWDKVDRATSYFVSYRRDEENYVNLPEISVSSVEILDASPGFYTFSVQAANAIGKRSGTSVSSKVVFGKTSIPVDVTNFSMIPKSGLAQLTWDRAPDLDVLVGGFVRIRHTPKTTSQQWKDGVDIVPALAGSSNSAVVPLITGTYMAKFVDSSGNFSATEAQIVTTIPDSLPVNVVYTVTENPGFAGVKTDMAIDTLNNALVLNSGELIDDVPAIDGLGSFDFPGEIVPLGTYDFQNIVDLNGVWPTRLTRVIDLEAFDINNLIDQRIDLIDTWSDIDGDVINDVNAELYVRTTEDNPSGSPTWTVWKPFSSAEYNARGFQFQLKCMSGSETHNLFIKQLSVTLDVEDRVENLGPVASGTGVYAVVYSYPFFAAPSIAITATNMQTGDYWTISSETANGFNIVFKNAAGSNVNRNFYVLAKGYGRKVA